MENLMRRLQPFLFVVAVLAAAAPRAQAATIAFDNSNPVSIPGLTGFQTFGSMMDGMTVTATFSDGLVESRSWADTGATSGGVSGTGWTLGVTGDTFNLNFWTFTDSDTSARSLVSLELDGSTGLTVFDTTFNNNLGTDGSSLGLTFFTGLAVDGSVSAIYSRPVAIGANAPVLDLYQLLTIDFTGVPGGGINTSFTFTQDTDNDSRFADVPEPATLLLVFGGVAAAAARRRQRPRR
jgi:hypothetical protein